MIGLALGYSILPFRGDRWWLGAVVGVAAIVGVLPLTYRRIRAIQRSEQPILVAVEALVLLVTLLVLGFAAVYFSLDERQQQFEGLATRLDAVYFTVTTLATVGYGDIHPTGQAARAVAIPRSYAPCSTTGTGEPTISRRAAAAPKNRAAASARPTTASTAATPSSEEAMPRRSPTAR